MIKLFLVTVIVGVLTFAPDGARVSIADDAIGKAVENVEQTKHKANDEINEVLRKSVKPKSLTAVKKSTTCRGKRFSR